MHERISEPTSVRGPKMPHWAVSDGEATAGLSLPCHLRAHLGKQTVAEALCRLPNGWNQGSLLSNPETTLGALLCPVITFTSFLWASDMHMHPVHTRRVSIKSTQAEEAALQHLHCQQNCMHHALQTALRERAPLKAARACALRENISLHRLGKA